MGQEAAQQPFGLVGVERLPRRLVLDQLDPVEVAGPADVADDRQVEQLLQRRAERRAFSLTWSLSPSRSKMSRLAIATADDTGCPPKVNPCANVVVPLANGSNSRSDAIIAPIGAYPDVIPLAQVIMSGT